MMCNGVAMTSSPTAAGAENQAGTEETMDDGDDEWEYDYYAVVPDAVPGDMSWMGAVESDAAGDEDDPWDTSRAAVVVMRYAAGMAEIHDEEEWDSDGDDGCWENDMSDDDGKEYDYPDEDDEPGGLFGGSSEDSAGGGGGSDDY